MLLRKARGALRRDEQLQAMRFTSTSPHPNPSPTPNPTLLPLQAMRFKLVPTRVTEVWPSP